MLFNSQEFIFFFVPLTFCVYQIFIRSHNKGAKLWLILCSLFFYAYWNPLYVILLITSIVTNYGCSVFIFRVPASSKRKLFLLLGITANLAAIGYFKYENFFVENFNYLTGFGFATNQILLPLAISFFTFQQIAYIVDVYLGKETKSTIIWNPTYVFSEWKNTFESSSDALNGLYGAVDGGHRSRFE